MDAEPRSDLDGLARDLGLLARRLLERLGDEAEEGAPQVGALVREHLGDGAVSMPVVSAAFSAWDQANLQIALDAALAREGWSAETTGLAGQARHYAGMGLGDMMRMSHFPAGPVEYASAEIGPGRTLACVDFAVLLVTSPGGPLAAFVHRGDENPFARASDIQLQVIAPERSGAEEFIATLHALIAEHDVFRGQVITVRSSMEGASVAFVERPVVEPSELVLPDGVLARIERHLAGPSEHRERLMAMGRHMSRGLLLWGPPGTGKTLTVRYLTGRLRDATVIILSSGSLGAVGAFGAMARRLAPSLVILEDVDLVAEERTYDGGSEVLFELMNQMSGMDEDADVAFVLTTNRPEALEPALAARPGRVDLAVEIPLPDAASRARLIEIYGRGLDLRLDDVAAVVERTEGVTASFIKELLRKATLGALSAGREHVTDADVGTALDELMSETSALTRMMLGAGGEDASRPASSWLGRFSDEGEGWTAYGTGSDEIVVELGPE